jgi:hypothetical protein
MKTTESGVAMATNDAGTAGQWRPWVLREAALEMAQARLSREPRAIEPRFERARLLGELGRTEEAKQAYLEVLVLSPSHFGALNNLGAILHASGFRTAARTCYAEAAARHPENPIGHVNLANALLEEGDLVPARDHFEKALQIAPDFADAHRGLGNLFWMLGDEEASKRHQRLGFQNRNVITMPYRGRRQPIPVLLVISAMAGNIPIGPFLDDQIYLVTVIVAEFCDPAAPLPPHRLMINAIGDADLCKPALQAAMKLAARTRAPVLNHPAAVLETGRIANASRLRHVPGVITPAMTSLPRAILAEADALETLASLGFACPFLLRTPGFHNGQNFFKIENAGGLKAALEKLPGREFTVMQFLDGRSADGKIRKYRAMMIGGEIFPLHAAISHDWKVHYVTAEMGGRPEHLAEDEAFLNAMPEVLGPCAMTALEGIRDGLGLDYAGVDFSVNESGQVLLFEANATMVVIAPEPDEQWAYRRAPVERVLNAIRKLLADKAAPHGENAQRKVA